MTEAEARDRVAQLAGCDAAMDRLDRLVALIVAENEQQNLIARSTVATIWHRHLLDSVQLVPLAGEGEGRWFDIGTGGGFPGLAVAAASDRPITLVEPRSRRAAFLADAAAALGLSHVAVSRARVEQVAGTAAVVTARAVAVPVRLIAAAAHLATPGTRWLLQRGAAWQDDLAALHGEWKGVFHVEHSLAAEEGRIIVADGVARA